MPSFNEPHDAALCRVRKEDFGELRHQDDVSPACPINSDELRSYCTQAEHLQVAPCDIGIRA